MDRIHISDLADSMKLYLDSIKLTVENLNMPLEKLNQVQIKSKQVEEEPIIEVPVKDEETEAQKQSRYVKEVNKLNSKKLKSFITIKQLEETTIADLLKISVGTLHNYVNNSCFIPTKSLKLLNDTFALDLEVVESKKKVTKYHVA